MVREHYEYAIQQILGDKNREIEAARERVIREKVIPHNNEIDQARDKAIAELSAKLNEDIAILQAKYTKERQALIDAADKNKSDFETSVIESEIAIVSVKCDQAVNDLTSLIAKLKE